MILKKINTLLTAIKKSILLENYFIFFVVFLFFLYPLTQSGFIGDDAYNSQIKGRLIQENSNIFNFWLREVSSWYWNNGRLYPLSFYSYFLFFLIENVFIYKIFCLILILLNIFYFRKIILHESKSNTFANISIFLILIFFQIRPWHDSILSFHSLIPMITFFFFLSFNHYQIFIETNKNKNLYLSSIFFLITLLMYEISYLFIFIFLFYKFKVKDFKKKIFNLKIHIIFLIVCFILVIVARIKIYITGELYYPSIEANFIFKNFLIATFYQIVGTIPAIFTLREVMLDIFYFNTKFDFQIIKDILINKFFYYKKLFLVTDIFFLFIYFYALKKLFNKQITYKFKYSSLFILGLLLVLLPSIVVGVSGHQNEIVRVGPGLSYIPVYLQYYGLCILFLILVCKNLSNNKWKILLIVTICIVPYVHLLNFREVVNNSNIKYKYPSDLLEKSINTGLLNHLGDKAVILNTNKIPADWIWFLSQKAKKKLNVCAIETFKDCPYVEQLKGNNSISNYEFNHKDFYYLNYDYNHKSKENKVFLYKIEKIIFNNLGLITSIQTTQKKYYNEDIKTISKFEVYNKNFILK